MWPAEKNHLLFERQARRRERIDGAGAHDRDLANAGAARRLDDVHVHHAIVIEQRALILQASPDPVNARRRMEDVNRTAPLEFSECRGRVDKIAVGARQRNDVLIAFGAQVIDERRPHQAGGAGHKNCL